MELSAVVWIADVDEWDRWAARCADYCDRRGYTIVAVISARLGGTWADVDDYLMNDHADVCVVADRGHLPRERHRRVEAVADERRSAELVEPARPNRPTNRPAVWSGESARPAFLRRTAGC